MNKANYIKQLIDKQQLEEAEAALRDAAPEELTSGDRYYVEGLLAAKRGDWKTAKNCFSKHRRSIPTARRRNARHDHGHIRLLLQRQFKSLKTQRYGENQRRRCH